MRCEPPPEHRQHREHVLSDGQVWRWVSTRWNRPGIVITADYAGASGLSWVSMHASAPVVIAETTNAGATP